MAQARGPPPAPGGRGPVTVTVTTSPPRPILPPDVDHLPLHPPRALPRGPGLPAGPRARRRRGRVRRLPLQRPQGGPGPGGLRPRDLVLLVPEGDGAPRRHLARG